MSQPLTATLFCVAGLTRGFVFFAVIAENRRTVRTSMSAILNANQINFPTPD